MAPQTVERHAGQYGPEDQPRDWWAETEKPPPDAWYEARATRAGRWQARIIATLDRITVEKGEFEKEGETFTFRVRHEPTGAETVGNSRGDAIKVLCIFLADTQEEPE